MEGRRGVGMSHTTRWATPGGEYRKVFQGKKKKAKIQIIPLEKHFSMPVGQI